MGGLTKKLTFFPFRLHTVNHQNFFTKPKLFRLVLSLLRDHIQGNTVEKNFQTDKEKKQKVPRKNNS